MLNFPLVYRFFAILVFSSVAFAQQTPVKTSVYLQSTAEDRVGKTLSYEIREAIRRSAGLTLADQADDARFILRLVTIDPDNRDSPGISTVYSAVYTMQTLHDTPVEMYLSSSVGTCGRNRTESCARSLTAMVDEYAVDFRNLLRRVLEDKK